MRLASTAIGIVLLSCGASPAAQQETAARPSLSPAPSPEAQSQASSSAVPSPMPSLVRFVVGPGVRPADEQLIRGAITSTATYLRTTFGSTREDAVINTVASKTADGRPAGAQGCCAAILGGTVYLDVDDQQWTAVSSADRMKASAHEYTHSFQSVLGSEFGCVGRDTDNPKRTPMWFYEGWAEYLAYQVALKNGWYSQSAVTAVVQRTKSDVRVTSLRMLSIPPLRGAQGLYSLGYVAADRLTAIAGPAGMRDFCVAVGRGNPWRDEFRIAFGMDADAFQDSFNAYVLSLP